MLMSLYKSGHGKEAIICQFKELINHQPRHVSATSHGVKEISVILGGFNFI